MQVTIHQALFGDKNDSLSLLKTSHPDEKLAYKICNSTDLSDRGQNWSPAIRGFSFEDNYILLKTYSDTSPQVRQGRVFSHALIIEKKDISRINNLEVLYDHFQNEMNKDLDIQPIIYSDREFSGTIDKDRIIKAAEGLLNEEQIVWIGQDNFPNAIATLWKNFKATSRFEFKFGINFNPTSVSNQNIVCTPDFLLPKWQNTNFCVVDKEDKVTKPSQAALFLVSGDKNSDFYSFLEQIGYEPISLKQLSLLERGLDTFTSLESNNDFNEVFNLFNILNTNKNTSEVKNDLIVKVIQRLIQIIPNAGSQSINALRKLKLTKELVILKTELEEAIRNWFENKLFDSNFNLTNDTGKVLGNIIANDSEEWWINTVKNQLKTFFSEWKKEYAPFVIKWLNGDLQNIIKALSEFFNSVKEIENDLQTQLALPSNNLNDIEFKKFCLKNKWFVLHARVLINSKANNIVEEQLSIDSKDIKGLKLISENISRVLFLESAIKNNDDRLNVISGSLIIKDRKLLSEMNISIANWQKILVEVIKIEPVLSKLFKKPYQDFLFPVFDTLIDGNHVENDLLSLLSKTEYRDIKEYPHRKVLWELLGVDVKENFISATVKSISANIDFLEAEYEDAIKKKINSDEFVDFFIKANKSDVGKIVNLFIKFDIYDEKSLYMFLQQINTTFNSIDAQKLGKLVYNKKWRNCLSIIQSKAVNNQSFKIAFQDCCGLLSFLAYGNAVWQGLITKVDISNSDWWQSLEDLLCKLYPEGPIDNKIWKRAGGDESELQHKSTGKEMWRNALHKLNNGGTKKTSINNLLIETKKDFPNNNDLNILIEIKMKI